jgi:hypothetical protein
MHFKTSSHQTLYSTHFPTNPLHSVLTLLMHVARHFHLPFRLDRAHPDVPSQTPRSIRSATSKETRQPAMTVLNKHSYLLDLSNGYLRKRQLTRELDLATIRAEEKRRGESLPRNTHIWNPRHNSQAQHEGSCVDGCARTHLTIRFLQCAHSID